jgi:cytoskeletal protein RodZ
MRAVVIVLLALFVCGCLSQQAEIKPDDAKMNALFADAVGQGATTSEAPTTTPQSIAAEEEPSTTQATASTTSSTTTSSSVTSSTVRGPDCTDINVPMGRKDCEKGYCPITGQKCGYLPGNIYGGVSSRCVCLRP